ncbi:hypothetical protein NQ314_019175 [Rhamnusium bicolor]|uniref:Uncharacterized protein n=1 Tax=Rhamnusium bicolor TaxID=1586634 RepID=A0AAV8WP54_9CUCU|nr:hypothetical protein NQ314_019175 [Rhamnusium bicolor]
MLFGNMTPRRAIDMMNRHTFGKPDDLCLEITSALTDSIISNATAPESPQTTSTHSRNKICCCNGKYN